MALTSPLQAPDAISNSDNAFIVALQLSREIFDVVFSDKESATPFTGNEIRVFTAWQVITGIRCPAANWACHVASCVRSISSTPSFLVLFTRMLTGYARISSEAQGARSFCS